MRRPAHLKSLTGALLAAVATAALLLLPVVLTWGSKSRTPSTPGERAEAMEDRKTLQLRRVTAVARPGDLSPFGANFQPDKTIASPGSSEKREEFAKSLS